MGLTKSENRDAIADEISRMYAIAHDPNVADLLGALLGGFERNDATVKKVRLFAHRWFCSDWPEQAKILKACDEYLRSVDLKYMPPEYVETNPATLNLLKEIEESENELHARAN